jgi:hypothetical protein
MSVCASRSSSGRPSTTTGATLAGRIGAAKADRLRDAGGSIHGAKSPRASAGGRTPERIDRPPEALPGVCQPSAQWKCSQRPSVGALISTPARGSRSATRGSRSATRHTVEPDRDPPRVGVADVQVALPVLWHVLDGRTARGSRPIDGGALIGSPPARASGAR